MAETKDLPTAIQQQLDSKLASAGEAARAGDFRTSIMLSLEAWDFIPDPKEMWDFYPQTMSSNMVDDYVAIGDIASTKQWIEITYRMYGDDSHEDHFVLMLEGVSLYKLGLSEEAYEVFAKIYDKYGHGGFAGEQRTYLEFFLKEKARRGG